jgi:hypothetical protein
MFQKQGLTPLDSAKAAIADEAFYYLELKATQLKEIERNNQ